MFSGAYTAIVTPFKNGAIDEEAYRKLIDFQIENGIAGIVPTGSTGEAATLDAEEHLRVIRIAVEQARGRCKIVAGTGSNSTREAIDLSVEAAALGVDGLLLASPYYNKPTQEGTYRHFKAISDRVNTPIMLYNVPSRTASEIAVETCVRLVRDCANIVSIKEAGGSCDRVSALRNALPPSFTILSGDDSLTLPFLIIGAVGVVSVASNVIPKQVTEMVNGFLAGRAQEARDLHLRWYPIFKDLFIESNPIPVKAALNLMGLIQAEYRLPLCEMSSTNLDRLKKTLAAAKLI
ncbi:MAG: 4-hydroxy-tetrahydrodipicolinate synthase [Verrucomicrobia bacterium]|jgi:4-hydroxy-tetrahydrodipicolinate synthase|nr:4-hydroxy-tetrahydrodipicolinate synthase [Verrucomicrobiota bacterium]MBV9273766.1 4-hydroxy-tetrahydrodipicolinate synthase [Verrucomicrobiota bacterium]